MPIPGRRRAMTLGANNRLGEARRLVEDTAAQWLWFALPGGANRVGYGWGPYTWMRRRRHTNLRRDVHICLLDYVPGGGRQSRFTEFWINERSRACSASLNGPVEEADVVWVYCKDPIPPDQQRPMLEAIGMAGQGVPVINHPSAYNSYSESGTFAVLSEAGVSVPRVDLGPEDVGRTPTVYKTEGGHGHTPKVFSKYAGPKPGFQAFEFVDSRDAGGLYRRYRAYHVVGVIQPGTVLLSEHHNVLAKSAKRAEPYGITPEESEQIRLIGERLNLQYFAVDYLRRGGDDSPVFVDINVYPDVHSKLVAAGRKLGYFGQWYSLETRTRLGLSGPEERPFWEAFDEGMRAYTSPKGSREP